MAFEVDLRSDTVTAPTSEMREAMAAAAVGDDCYGEDPTVNALQKLACDVLGTEAALFVPTGTMANQIALRVFASPGGEVICDSRCHLMEHESGATAILSQAQLRGITTDRGVFTADQVASSVRPANPFTPATVALAIENTHNSCGGTVWTVDEMREAVKPAHDASVPVVLDGARLFNACAVAKASPSDYAALADAVCISLYKGLCAPGGSLVCGSAETIDRAWKWRRIFGGAMRQAGILAAAGIIALEKMQSRLSIDHALATRLFEGLRHNFDVEQPQTNMVILDAAANNLDARAVLESLARKGIGAGMISPTEIRFVTHNDVDEHGIDLAVRSLIAVL